MTLSNEIEHPGRNSLGYPGRVHHGSDPERQETPCEKTNGIGIANRIRRAEDQLAYNKRRTVVGPGHDVGTGADDELRVQPAMSRPAAGVSGSE